MQSPNIGPRHASSAHLHLTARPPPRATCRIPPLSLQGRYRPDHLVSLRKPPGLVLAEYQLPVRCHVEDSPAALDQLGLDAQRLLQLVRQTGGSRQVVSLRAVRDRNSHRLFILSAPAVRAAAVRIIAEPPRFRFAAHYNERAVLP